MLKNIKKAKALDADIKIAKENLQELLDKRTGLQEGIKEELSELGYVILDKYSTPCMYGVGGKPMPIDIDRLHSIPFRRYTQR